MDANERESEDEWFLTGLQDRVGGASFEAGDGVACTCADSAAPAFKCGSSGAMSCGHAPPFLDYPYTITITIMITNRQSPSTGSGQAGAVEPRLTARQAPDSAHPRLRGQSLHPTNLREAE